MVRRLHDFARARHGKDYFRPDQGVDLLAWEDARDFLEEDFSRVTRTGKPMGDRAQRNVHTAVLSLLQFRREEALDDDRKKRDWENARDLPAPKVRDEPGSGWQPFRLEHVHLILKSSQSYETVPMGDPAGGAAIAVPSEDGEFSALLLYTAGRAQFIGLRANQADLLRLSIRTRIKGDYFEEIPLHDELVRILRDFIARDPGRRMLFRGARYAYHDKRPWAGGGSCSYGEGCGVRSGLWTYYGVDRDEPLCRKHLKRTIGTARQMNRQLAKTIMDRVERALHRLHPDALEERWDPATQSFVRVPIHVHAHRFRETVVTHGLDLGFTPEQVTQLTKHKSDAWKRYNKPSLAQMRTTVGRVDLAKASEAAARGERTKVRTDNEETREVLQQILEELRIARDETARLRRENEELRAGAVRADVAKAVGP